MNPDTGRFVALADGQAAPAGWAVFRVGQEVLLDGHPFRIARINRSSIVVQPMVAVAGARASVAMASLAALPPVRSSRRRKRGRRKRS